MQRLIREIPFSSAHTMGLPSLRATIEWSYPEQLRWTARPSSGTRSPSPLDNLDGSTSVDAQ
jgi:hypothetical protein